MLQVVEILPVEDEARVSIDLYQPVCIDWKHGYPIAWWGICHANDYYLMIGYEFLSGRVFSLETPAYREHVELDGPCWDLGCSTEGHPRIAIEGPEWKVDVDPVVRAFQIDHSREDVKIRWGTDVRSLRFGRCMFGLDEQDRLVSIGVVDMSVEEHEVLHRGLTFRRR